MAGQLLLINPRRRKRNASKRRHHAVAAKRRANPHGRTRRRRNIMSPLLLRTNPHRRHRRRNPLAAYRRRHHHHRRRNPLAMGGLMAMIKDAAIASAGGVALDYLFGYVNGMVPATMKRTPGTIGIGDAVKVGFNVLVGTMLDKPTKGLARKAAEGSMTVHFYQLISGALPTTTQAGLASTGAGLGWYQPAPVTRGTQWTTPNRGRVNRGSPLLSIFSRGSPALSMVPTVASPFAVPTVASVPAGVPIR
jgi:hypothetical protein